MVHINEGIHEGIDVGWLWGRKTQLDVIRAFFLRSGRVVSLYSEVGEIFIFNPLQDVNMASLYLPQHDLKEISGRSGPEHGGHWHRGAESSRSRFGPAFQGSQFHANSFRCGKLRSAHQLCALREV